MKWLNCLRKPNFDITITVFQALVLLAEKYRGDVKNAKKYEVIKTLCLSGVRNPKDEQVLENLLADNVLLNYRISSRKRDINADPVRRYFESQICHKILSTSLDVLDQTLLERHLDSIVRGLSPEEQMNISNIAHSGYHTYFLNKHSEGIFSLSKANSFQSFRPESPTGIVLADQVLDVRKKKMRLLATAMYAAKKSDEALPNEEKLTDLYYQQNSVYDPKNRERKKKIDLSVRGVQEVYSNRLGIMAFHMPLSADDDLLAETVSRYTRSADKFSYVGGGPVLANPGFKTQVAPFVGSISGTMWVKLMAIARLLRKNEFVYQFEPDQLKLFLQSHIAYMLYQAGGHSLDEYVRVLQLPEVQAEFKSIPSFVSITLDSLFKEGNSTAFDAALDKTIAYNRHILNTKKVQAELERQRSGALGTVSLCVAAKNRQFTVVNPGILSYLPLFLLIYKLDEKRLSSEKDAGWRHQFTQLVGLFLLFTVTKVLGGAVVDTSPDKRSEPSVFQS
ncbi:MAG: hypothetical protein K0U37_08535 [Gammaproteobacteria bacterium]|nr:hypothetical protein [Gammaproteobacteria bacterium]